MAQHLGWEAALDASLGRFHSHAAESAGTAARVAGAVGDAVHAEHSDGAPQLRPGVGKRVPEAAAADKPAPGAPSGGAALADDLSKVHLGSSDASRH